jgi:hypothetical protein
MGNSRAGAGGGTALHESEQRSRTTKDASGEDSGAATKRHGSRRKPRLSPADRKVRGRRRTRRFLVISAIIAAGFVAGLIGGMISGVV